ncbi:MAG: phage holin family protein [Firmicutes bacterium]|nr:phage holin family protein [Bacillota bacterium]
MSETTLKGIFAAVATLLTFVFGQWDTLMQGLVVFVTADLLAGSVAAVVTRDLDSGQLFHSILRKVLVFVMVAVAAQLDKVMQTGQNPLLRTVTIWFFIGQEGVSIIENAGRAGLPLPTALRQALRRLHESPGAAPKG